MHARILPFYLVCDESYSMSDHLDVVRDSLREVHDTVRSDPAARRHTRLCLIGFSAEARVITPLSQRWDQTADFTFQPNGGTNFAAAFTLLRRTIDDDVAELTAAGHDVLRPVVFFLSDGQPTDTAWPHAHARLTDPGWPARPRVVAFGVGDADVATISRVGSFKAYLGNGRAGTGAAGTTAALRQCVRALATTMVRTGAAITVRLDPAELAGFTEISSALSTSDPTFVHTAG
ncbi:vWA domain-containing protein [Labedaea rhizosphaerae]|uniref:Uncharacterized protein YegL n=1 Tax=Labedaea rhizosphaerae TaxID=598644 RepID=A0A4R6SDN9_LABRH|nr:VWA domain-containing protein [Labedaea rhizosphaerae]TDP97992.1 uncharacterized protein YegL [Labedaea rhizosphaerae]